VRSSAQLLGGAVVALRTPELPLLEGRSDLAALWDIRVAPDRRGCGLGAMLFRATEDWARARECVGLKVETQNVNVPACRFYQRQGCVLSSVQVGAYPSLPDEVQLIWSKILQRV
jgi:GNAT superfamily N-acetyltransferase